MTKDVLPGSRSKSYSQQKNIVAELVKTTGVSYQVPTILEAATCILAEYSRSENRLFSDSPWTYTRCQENVQGYQMVVGGFAPAGLSVYYYDYDDDHLKRYADAAADDETFFSYLEQYITGVSSHEQYLDRIGREALDAVKADSDFGYRPRPER